MAKNESGLKEYGTEEQVPQSARHYSFFDMLSTWVGANCQPNSWYIGGCLAASGFAVAAGVTLIANPISYVFLALMGFMGYKVATTSMGLTRFSFGIHGSRILTVLNLMTLIGWTGVGRYLAAISMSYLFNTLWGWPSYGQEGCTWVLVVGALITGVLSGFFAWVGGSKSVKYAENIAVVAMIALTVWITYAVLSTYSLSDIFAWRPSEDVRMPLGVGIDSIVAYSMSWVPAVADYTRYTKSKKASTVAPVIGATVGIYWFAMVGTVAVIAAALKTGVFNPNASDPSSVAAALGLGIPALLVVILSVVTTNMISLYSGGVSVMNMFKKGASVKKGTLFMGVVTILFSMVPIFMASFLDFFYTFMDFLGLVFPPLIAVMLIDYYIIRRQNYIFSEVGNRSGPYWYTNGFNKYAVGSWLFGVAVFLAFKAIGPVATTVGAVFPSFIATGIAYFISAKAAVRNGYYRDVQARGTGTGA